LVALQYVVFALVAVGLYLLSDRLLRRIERAAGRVLPERSLIFMAILLVLAVASFWLIRRLWPV
jgi:p-aminobenzoyl-glutamate transporter AbgT